PQHPSPFYRGLAPFYADHAPYFFGRQGVVDKLVYALYTKPLVTLIGPSGSGKSSVIFAGLLPKFRQEAIIVQLRPGHRPFFQLANALISALHPHLSETEQLREAHQLTLALQNREVTLRDMCDFLWQKHPDQHRFLLVIDQLEELYTLCPNSATQQQFIELLLQPIAVRDRLPTFFFTLVCTLRADFLQHTLRDRQLATALCTHSPELLQPMTRQELQDTIRQPAAKQGITIAPGLTERILDAVGDEPGHLPLLEFALTLLWDRQEGGCLTHSGYESIGGVQQALASHAEQFYNTLSPDEQQQARRLFLQLVHPGDETADTRRIANRTELGEQSQPLLQKLVKARLVIVAEDSVEIVHEALISAWDRLGHWLAEDRTFRLWQEQLRVALRQWDNSHQDDGYLLHGTPLLEAQRWLSDRQDQLTPSEQAYIQASLTRQHQEQRHRHSLKQQIVWLLSTGLMISLTLGLLAGWQWQRANTGKVGVRLSILSLSSEQLFASKKELESLFASIRAAQQVRTSRNLQPETRMRTIAALQQTVYGIREYNHLEDHDRTVIDVAFSPDGEYLASASDDHTVKLWAKNGQQLATLTDHQDLVRQVAWQSDSQQFASVSYDGTVKVWNVDGQLQWTDRGQDTKLTSVAIHPQENTIVAAGMDGSLQFWDNTGQLQATRKGHGTAITDVVWSPDGTVLASGSSNSTVKLWANNGQRLATLRGHEQSVTRLAFSPDSQTLASVSKGGKVRLWDKNDQLLQAWPAHEDVVWGVAFSPDGRLLATASADQTIRLWRLDGTLVTTFAGHNASTYSVSFSPDAQTLASASADTTIKLWHPQPRSLRVLRHESPVQGVIFHSQGQQVLTATQEGRIRRWGRNGSLQKILTTYPDFLTELQGTPTQEVVSVGLTGRIQIQSKIGRER
ncbi:WD40 repeat domain-containing protein, partial [Spirulina sp. CS-785/01]|uniref:NACHT and WD repeat domain-containing protein n=1 Tax=Spirulina sp. CS-785/01 TaxID=3021716 RepID=UPI002330AC11